MVGQIIDFHKSENSSVLMISGASFRQRNECRPIQRFLQRSSKR